LICSSGQNIDAWVKNPKYGESPFNKNSPRSQLIKPILIEKQPFSLQKVTPVPRKSILKGKSYTKHDSAILQTLEENLQSIAYENRDFLGPKRSHGSLRVENPQESYADVGEVSGRKLVKSSSESKK
jgi:hypothetical protein